MDSDKHQAQIPIGHICTASLCVYGRGSRKVTSGRLKFCNSLAMPNSATLNRALRFIGCRDLSFVAKNQLRAVARALAMNARIFAGSFCPGADSTPLTTSTPQGRSLMIASSTLVGESPPAAIKLSAPAWLKRPLRAASQSNAAPVPPTAFVVRESTRIPSVSGSLSAVASRESASGKCTTRRIRSAAP